MKKYAGVHSLITYVDCSSNEEDTYQIIGNFENGRFSCRNEFERAVLGACIGDKRKIGANEPYFVKIIDIQNPISLQELFKYEYNPQLEGVLLSNIKDEAIPFPFMKKLYIGRPSLHKCKSHELKWEMVSVRFFYKGGQEKRIVHVCAYCKKAILDSMPYKEEKLKDFYHTYDLLDEQFLNKIEKMHPDIMNIRYWQMLLIQGGAFTGK